MCETPMCGGGGGRSLGPGPGTGPGPSLAPALAWARALGLGLGPGSGPARGVLGRAWGGSISVELRRLAKTLGHANPGVAKGCP